MTKTCTKCGRTKSTADFHKNKQKRDGLRTWCKSCHKASAKEYYLNNKNACNERNRRWTMRNSKARRGHVLRYRYGVSITDYEDMLAAQGMKCKICGVHASHLDKALAVDHCHATGAVRGLLCTACNTAIGLLDNNPVILRKAAAYLGGHARG